MKTTQRAYDLAYGCFLVCGLTVLSMRVVRSSYTDAEWAGGAAGLLFIFLPAILASCIATLVGIITESLTGYGSTTFQNAVPVAYGVGVAAMSGMWFLVLRRRYLPPVVPTGDR
ncbi:MAG: hypothetical protein DMF52_01800 [Acidobacteria bacterium]|nr:MAG: hypothetical protein DMF52_01800 [Acidobacteriota bacterium]